MQRSQVDAGQKAFVARQNLEQLKENVANARRPWADVGANLLQAGRDDLSPSVAGDMVRAAHSLDESAVLVYARARLTKLDDITP
jgi:hypothetical protein